MEKKKFLFIKVIPENREIIKKLKIMFLICGILNMLLFIILYLIDSFIWGFYFISFTLIWVLGLYYVSFCMYKISKIKIIIIITPIFISIIIFLEILSQILGWYEDANHFFFLRYDMLSHFFSGIIVFLVLLMIFSLFETKYRIENMGLILTIILLFLWELVEELIEFIYKDKLIGFENKFFWNSIQDMIMNCLGIMCIYFLFKKYLVKRVKIIIFS